MNGAKLLFLGWCLGGVGGLGYASLATEWRHTPAAGSGVRDRGQMLASWDPGSDVIRRMDRWGRGERSEGLDV
ncbi:hypothetical protein B0T09DRAFT_92422 [Sordaria sp. MPI-SDFR-AT-0083]|nr:hypothetical protein B0T09DRAFT_92422 [Sordaria sp. MPI-SDFR-AT-0083]